MPITRLTCPHCEQEVDVNVTDVTRSRDCPRCGRYIILQFTTKATRMKRRALLTHSVPVQVGEPAVATAAARSSTVVARPAATATVTGREAPASIPRPVSARPVAGIPPVAALQVAQPLEGTPGERLLHDPDMKRKGGTLLWGLLGVGALIALVIAADQLHWWKAIGDTFTKVMAQISPPTQAPVGQSGTVAVDPKLPTAKEVLSAPVQAPEMKLPDEVDSPPATTPGVMSEQEQAMRAVQAFLEAKSLKERLKLVRDDSLMVDKMVKYYEANDPGPIAFQKIVAREANPAGMLTFAFEVVVPNGENRRVIAMKSRVGKYFIDWASFVLYGDMTWKQFMDVRPVTPTLMRVFAEPGDHFNEVFPKSSNLLCLKLTDPRAKDSPVIYAYATQGTPLGMALEFILRKGVSEAQPVIITLKYPQESAGGEANQVWVEELVAEGWLARGR
jgi:hypothetical protein